MFPAPNLESAISLRSLTTFSEKWNFKTIIMVVMPIATRFVIVPRRELGYIFVLF